MSGWIQQNLMFVLSVQIDEWRSQLAQRARRGERAVDECPTASALRRDLTPDDQLRFIVPLEYPFDDGSLLPGSYEIARGAAPGDQPHGADKDRFSGAGFAGQDRETWLELELELIDNGEIADAEEP
jgi:hypothetical protein